MTTDILRRRLSDSPVWRRFEDHPFFQRVDDAPLTERDVAIFVGQWWHPLHYFPTFLARCAAVVPDIGAKAAVTVILSQETGDGAANRAHEVIYADSMERVGIDRQTVVASDPFPATKDLVSGYRRLSATPVGAAGGIFATEVTDLQMVSAIGQAIRRVHGAQDIEWVDIHVTQEPEHVQEADRTLFGTFASENVDAVVRSAEELWELWIAFFDCLHEAVFESSPTTVDAV